MLYISNLDLVDLFIGRFDIFFVLQFVQIFIVLVVSIESDSFFVDFVFVFIGGGSISGSENNFNSGKELVIIIFYEVLKMYMYGQKKIKEEVGMVLGFEIGIYWLLI